MAVALAVGRAPDNTKVLIFAALIVLCVYLFINKPTERNFSGGDYAIPSFKHGGKYSDCRDITFNRPSSLPDFNFITGHSFLTVFLLACICMLFTLRNE
jgi:hypothetical protein